ncbi:MAG TPA: ABC transporter permease, partial [Gemmatimonadales bacterium]|nr:ABC transporter permease [Gemmatimonadales bacterium]
MFSDLRYRLRAVFRRGRVEQELDDELRFHLERETQEYLRRGFSQPEAARRARLAFGRIDDAKEASRDGRGTGAVSQVLNFARTLRHAARRLRRAPSFSITAVLTLGLGIGATSAVFSIVDGVLLRPLPYPGSERLVDLGHTLQLTGVMRVEQSDASFLFYRRENTVFAEVGAYQPRAVNVGGRSGGAQDQAEADRATAARVSASLFPALAVSPLRGRVLVPEDDRPGAAPVVILGERLWKRNFGSDPGVVGRSVPVDGVPHQIVGVMPERFRFPESGTELWLPSGIDPARTESASFGFQAVARLKDGATVAAAEAELNRLLPRLPEAFPGRLTAGAITATRMRAVVRPLRDAVVGEAGRVLWIALGAIGFVLLAACGNLANLFLVRAEGRSREVALRRALGAGWAASLGEAMAESLVVAALGGALGVGLAAAGVRAFQVWSGTGGWGELPRLAEVRVDGAAIGFAAGLTVLTALLVSFLPMLRTRRSPPNTLTVATRSSTAGRDRHLVRYALVVSQVGLALVLLAGAGVMARSFARLKSVAAGFDPAGVLTLRVALPAASYPTAGDVTRFDLRALDGFAAIAGVRAAALASKLPLG